VNKIIKLISYYTNLSKKAATVGETLAINVGCNLLSLYGRLVTVFTYKFIQKAPPWYFFSGIDLFLALHLLSKKKKKKK